MKSIRPVITSWLRIYAQSKLPFLIILCCSSFGCRDNKDTAHYHKVEVFNSGNNSEKVNSIQVGINDNWTNGAVLFSVKLPDLNLGDSLEIWVDMEVTNDVTPDQNVVAVSQIILTDSPLKLPDATQTIVVKNSSQYDVTPDRHHGHIVDTCTFVCRSDFQTDRYVNFCMYAKSNTPGMNDWLTINQDYGRLSVLVFKR